MNDELKTELGRRIDEVLFYVWDPIGVNVYGEPTARDEYSGYVPRLLDSLNNGADWEAVRDILATIRDEAMDDAREYPLDTLAAKSIVAWREES